MVAPLRFIPHTTTAQAKIALDQPQWTNFVNAAANATGSKKNRPYIYNVNLPNGEKAYSLLTAKEKKQLPKIYQGAVYQKLKLADIARISEDILPIHKSSLQHGQKSQLCNDLLKMARKLEAKDTSGIRAAARKISNDFNNLFKTAATKRPLAPTSAQEARRVVAAYPSVTGTVAPAAPTTLDKVHTFFTNLIHSPNFSRAMKALAIGGAITLIVLTGRLEMIAVLVATVIIQQIITKKMDI